MSVKVVGGGTADLPQVFACPIRTDIVQQVHTSMAKNARQAYGVKVHNGPKGIVAGHQHSAHSWGTGRAVARIPRVSGSGTHRAGQAAFGNMCRGGRMFGPTKTWRKWQKKINQKQRRYATACAIAASGKLSLVQARGHRTEGLASFPVVVSTLGDAKNTGGARDQLVKLGLGATAAQGDEPAPNSDELARAAPRPNKPGKGKLRGRRHKKKRGPLIVFSDLESGDAAAAEAAVQLNYRNLPGVDLCQVSALNLLQLAPGGHLGRLVIWTEAAFKQLDAVYEKKTGFSLPTKVSNAVRNADIAAIINSKTVQDALREKKSNPYGLRKKKSGLKNLQERLRLDPFYQDALKGGFETPGPLAEGQPAKKKARTDDSWVQYEP